MSILFLTPLKKISNSWYALLFFAILIFMLQYIQPIRDVIEVQRLLGFLVGISIAKLYKTSKLPFINKIFYLEIIILLSTIILFIYYGSLSNSTQIWSSNLNNNIFDILVVVLLGGILIFSLNENSITYKVLNLKFLRFFGIISFPLYLVHNIWGINLGHAISNNHNYTIMYINYLFTYIQIITISIISASVLHFYTEKPYLKK